MSALATYIQYCTRNSSHGNLGMKRQKKVNQIRKEEVKLCLLVVDMIFYIRFLIKPKNILINKFNIVAGNKINLQKTAVYLSIH